MRPKPVNKSLYRNHRCFFPFSGTKPKSRGENWQFHRITLTAISFLYKLRFVCGEGGEGTMFYFFYFPSVKSFASGNNVRYGIFKINCNSKGF